MSLRWILLCVFQIPFGRKKNRRRYCRDRASESVSEMWFANDSCTGHRIGSVHRGFMSTVHLQLSHVHVNESLFQKSVAFSENGGQRPNRKVLNYSSLLLLNPSHQATAHRVETRERTGIRFFHNVVLRCLDLMYIRKVLKSSMRECIWKTLHLFCNSCLRVLGTFSWCTFMQMSQRSLG